MGAGRRLSGRGSLLIVRENELLRECATRLIKRGYAVRRLPAVTAETEGGAEDGLAPEIITDALAKYMPPFYAPSALERMQLFAVSKMRQDMSRYRSSLSFWKSQLADSRHQHARAALTNMLIDPSHVALQRNLKEREFHFLGFSMV